jgi:hypothetical protein
MNKVGGFWKRKRHRGSLRTTSNQELIFLCSLSDGDIKRGREMERR